jgi:transcriptional antiterminator
VKHPEENLRRMMGLLLDGKDYITLELLSQEMELSKRSVQNYLVKAEVWLKENGLHGLSILRKQGYGIRLLGEREALERLEGLMRCNQFSLDDGKAARRMEILRDLTFSNTELTIQYLADQFYVSRSAIVCDLEWVEQWLAKYRLRLFKTQRRGIGVVGDEISRRAAIAGYFDLKKTDGKTQEWLPARLERENLQNLRGVYSDKDISTVCAVIDEAEEEFEFFLSDEFFVSLVTHIIIGIFRLKGGSRLDEEFLPPDGEFPQLEMQAATFIARRLGELFQVELPESEQVYICIHLMSFNTFQGAQDANRSMPWEIEHLTIQLIEIMDAETGYSFSADEMLFFGLSYHIRAVVYRLKKNLCSLEPAVLVIPDNIRELFEVVKKQEALYCGICGVTPDQRELLSIAYHFKTSLERMTPKHRALLVSNFGIVSLVELANHLRENLPQLRVVNLCSTNQLSMCKDTSYDFIISTIQLDDPPKPLADLSHVAKSDYVHYIEEFMFSKLESEDHKWRRGVELPL